MTPVTVLTVCSGNLFRSPAAERWLAYLLPPDEVTVASAGTIAQTGAPMDPLIAQLLGGDGVAVAGFSARLLTRPMVRGATLVLGAAAEHRAAAARLNPRSVRRTFTLLEMERIVGVLTDDERHELREPTSVAARVERLAGLAHRRRHAGPEDIPDPVQGTDEDVENAYVAVRRACLTVGAALGRA